jgi:CubicO group peptidase (beta-lactamase class C family)
MFIAMAAAASTLAQPATTLWPTSRWTPASLASQGLLPDPILDFDSKIRAGAFGNIDHLLVVKNGRLVFNERYERDYREISRGRMGPIGCGEGCTDPDWMHEFNYYHPDWHPYLMGRDIHTLQSVTKSIAATVVGIALGRGRIGSLNRPVLDFFKYRSFDNADPRLKKVSVRDVLTMRSGIEWHEQDRPLDDTNTTVQLEKSPDWIEFTLSQPMNADPGTKWAYNSGGSMLLSGVVKTATSLFIDDYAKQQLFVPLGIKDFRWKATPTGHPDTEGGLYLSAPDLAKIGYLYLHDGVWNGRRILPAGWVADATSRRLRAPSSSSG